MLFRYLLTICLFLISNNSYSATVTGKVSPVNGLEWFSLLQDGQSFRSAQWDIIENLPPASSFTQHSLSANSNEIHLNNGTDMVKVNFNLIGAEYLVPNFRELLNNASGGSANVTSKPNVTFSGTGLGNKIVVLYNTITPFTHYRPLFTFPITESHFTGLSPGIYTGSVSINLSYNYMRGNISVRNTTMSFLNFQIEYNPASLDSIDFDSNNKNMNMTYDGLGSVSGKVEFNGIATGFFPNGLKVKAIPFSNNFHLKNTKDNNMLIPYSIGCSVCNDELVNKGIVHPDYVSLVMPSLNAKQVYFDIYVYFDTILDEKLSVGDYTDTFTLMFSANNI
jgi:hypothetical protein